MALVFCGQIFIGLTYQLVKNWFLMIRYFYVAKTMEGIFVFDL